MSENPHMPNPDDWQDMLRAILGPQAEDIINQLESQGGDPGEQLRNMMSPENMAMVTDQLKMFLGGPSDGPVNWELTEKVARENVAREHLDKLTAVQGDSARSALQAASLWLDAATNIDPASGPHMAWTRLDWVAHSLGTFRRLMEPVGENISRAFQSAFSEQLEQLPEEIKGLMGNSSAMMTPMIASLLGVQFGSALAELAVDSFGSTDTGVPLMEGSSAALVPANIATFSEGLEVPPEEVQMYVAVREAAAARLYTRVPWLRPRLIDTIREFASGIQLDTGSIEEQVRDMTMTGEMPEINMNDVFVLELSHEQQDAVERLEFLLSLIEGWVSEVSAQAVAAHLPHAVPLREMFNRRYATDNPGKHVWETQMGLELTPRRLREASTFWRLALQHRGMEARDNMWSHPDLLPTEEALDDPEKYFTGEGADIEAELDSFLEDLFNDPQEGAGPHEPGFDESADTGDDTGK